MYRYMRTRGTRVLLASLAAAGLTLAGCGSDEDAGTTAAPTTAAATTTAAPTTAAPATTAAPKTTSGAPATAGHHDTTSPSSAGSTAPAGASSAYCAAAMDINTVAAAGGDPDEDPVAFATTLLPPVRAAAALAPAQLAATFDTAVEGLQAAIDGDPSKLEDANQAGAQVDEFNVANCGWTQLPVTMENYHFTGMPATLAAGDYVFQLSNTGTELHVMVIVKKQPGVTESFDELLNDPDAESKVITVTGDGAAPGDEGTAFAHLEAGEYLVLCPIPIGTTGATEGSGPPHFTLGMHQTLTVS